MDTLLSRGFFGDYSVILVPPFFIDRHALPAKDSLEEIAWAAATALDPVAAAVGIHRWHFQQTPNADAAPLMASGSAPIGPTWIKNPVAGLSRAATTLFHFLRRAAAFTLSATQSRSD